jgi:hypothetical protein
MASAGWSWPRFGRGTNEIACSGKGARTAEGIALRPGEAYAGGETGVFCCSGLSLCRSRPTTGQPRASAPGQRLGVWEASARQRSGRPVLLSFVAV